MTKRMFAAQTTAAGMSNAARSAFCRAAFYAFVLGTAVAVSIFVMLAGGELLGLLVFALLLCALLVLVRIIVPCAPSLVRQKV